MQTVIRHFFFCLQILFLVSLVLSISQEEELGENNVRVTCTNTTYCSCNGEEITCTGLVSDPKEIRDFLAGVPGTTPIPISKLSIVSTQLPTLDLSSLSSFKIGTLQISNNKPLKEITGGLTPADVQRLEVTSNNLSAEGISDLIKLCIPASLQYIDFSSNGSPLRVGGGQFSDLLNMREVKLEGGTVDKLDKDAFLIRQFGSEALTLTIWLRENALNNEDIHPSNGLPWSTGIKPINIHLDNNAFVFLGEDRFKQHLDSNPKNRITFNGNSGFICDERMQWLVDGKAGYAGYEGRVENVMCSNYPGKTVFEIDPSGENPDEDTLVVNPERGNGATSTQFSVVTLMLIVVARLF